MEEVNILGAGVSGLSAAINLAKVGYEVKVFDAKKESGMRFGGDLQGLENWTTENDVINDIKSMNIKANFDYNGFKKIFISDGKILEEVNFERPVFYLVKRGVMEDSLDQALKHQAQDMGVKIFFNEKENHSVKIVATGPRRVNAIDSGFVFETEMDDIAVGLINQQAAYKGYSYLLINNGYGCFCTVLFDKMSWVNVCLKKTEAIFKNLLDLKVKKRKKVGGIWNFSLTPKLVENEKLFVGEAAGIQDVLWGFGIRHAITSGFLAAKSVSENLDYEKAFLERYRNQLKAGIVNRFLWERANTRFLKFGLSKVRKVQDPLKKLKKFYNYEYSWQKILYPFAKLSLHNRIKGL